jgi:hypothetical protein
MTALAEAPFFELSTGAIGPRWRPNTAKGGVGACPLPNHWLDQTAASLGSTVVAAAGQPLR